ncbi:MAG: glycosyltransferase family 4 protein [Saprospiraceae bacterium]|nr:glycosyltransferase family 4 protein [Saprospiraceae bacterium]
MRVAVNTRFLLPDKLEGIGWFTWEVTRRLVARYPDWEFVFLFDRPYDPAFICGPNVTPVVVPPPARHPVLWWAWFELSLPLALRRYRPDVFFTPDGYCSLAARVPTVMVAHDIAHVHFPDQVPVLVRRYYDYFVPRYLQRAERLITVSQFSKNDIVGHYGINPAKIDVACNGCRETFLPLSETEKQAVRAQYAGGLPYFFYLGAVHPRKNVDRLIEAFSLFKKQTGSPVKLLIGGRLSWQTGPVKAALEASAYRNDIRLLGYIPDEALPGLTGAALALTYVSLFEGFGVPLLEAMHTETPIITSATSSLNEVAGDAALLVDPTDARAIAQAMEQLYFDPGFCHFLAENGKKRRAFYTWDLAYKIIEENILHLV